jgi:hypothetical protein
LSANTYQVPYVADYRGIALTWCYNVINTPMQS